MTTAMATATATATDEAKMAEVEALADSLGNVQAACRKLGVNRSLFYKWLKRKEKESIGSKVAAEAGIAAPKRRRHPQSIPDSVTGMVLARAAPTKAPSPTVPPTLQ